VSDGLRRLVEQLGAQLGAQAQPSPPALVGGRWLDYLKLDEVQRLVAEARRLGGGSPVVLSAELMRRAALRQGLGLFHGGLDENGVEFGGTRDCVAAGGSRCRCAEDAVVEAAGSVREVDAAAVAAVRGRARVKHERFARRRRERLRVRVGAVAGVPRAAVAAGRRVVGLEGFGVPDSIAPVREVDALPLPDRVSAPRRVSSVARGRVTNVDAEMAAFAAKLGLEYSVIGKRKAGS
jgi:hypothetical protein